MQMTIGFVLTSSTRKLSCVSIEELFFRLLNAFLCFISICLTIILNTQCRSIKFVNYFVLHNNCPLLQKETDLDLHDFWIYTDFYGRSVKQDTSYNVKIKKN